MRSTIRADRAGLIWPLLGLLGPIVAVVLLGSLGALAPLNEPGIPDSEAIVRWGLPWFSGLRDVSAAGTVGALAVLCWCLPARESRHNDGTSEQAWMRLASATAWCAGTWVLSSVFVFVFTFAELAGLRLSDATLWFSLSDFATEFELGRYLASSTVLVAIVATSTTVVRTTKGQAILLLLALLALWPLALTGHAAGSLNHALAVESQALHLVGVCLWAGGLASVLLASRHLHGEQRIRILERYSKLAGWSFLAVLVSGLVSAVIRINTWSDLNSAYGLMLAAKVGGLALLGMAGWQQRRTVIAVLAQGQERGFRRLALTEIAVMAVTMGVGVALGRSAPPSAQAGSPLEGAEAILGSRMPGPLGWSEWFTAWRLDGLWTLLAIVALVWYWRGVRMLRARGDRWSWGRATAWTLGWLLLVWATSGSPGVYGKVLFSMHMVQHMTIATTVPILLVLGAPVTLLLRTCPRRTDGSYGAREWVLFLVQSSFLRAIGHPLAAGTIFIVSLVVFYYGGFFELSMRSHTAHVIMIIHFLIAGYLFASCIVGVDPGGVRPPYLLRMLMVGVVFGFHAFFSVSLMASSHILAGDWFRAVHPPWAAPLDEDQYLGASLGWGLGDYPLTIIAVALIWQWVKADHAEQRRLDRQADRDGGAALATYNAHLRRLSVDHEQNHPAGDESKM